MLHLNSSRSLYGISRCRFCHLKGINSSMTTSDMSQAHWLVKQQSSTTRSSDDFSRGRVTRGASISSSDDNGSTAAGSTRHCLHCQPILNTHRACIDNSHVHRPHPESTDHQLFAPWIPLGSLCPASTPNHSKLRADWVGFEVITQAPDTLAIDSAAPESSQSQLHAALPRYAPAALRLACPA